MSEHADNLIWVDLEMTGLDPDRDHIIEIATIITDASLSIVAEGPVRAIYQPDSVLESMDEWNTQQHARSGLTDRVKNSTCDVAMAERVTLEFVREYAPANASPMCGNSICQDRRFMYREMPALEAHFHYRNIDVSSLKELCKRWSPKVAGGFTKNASHRALDDIRDSIAELEYYKAHFLRLT